MVEKTRYERDEWLKDSIDNSLTKDEKKLIASAIPALKKLAEYK
jgi:hypothetical protein